MTVFDARVVRLLLIQLFVFACSTVRVQAGTLLVRPDLRLTDASATVDLPLWRWYSYASCYLLGCYFWDVFGGTGCNFRRFDKDYTPARSGDEFRFETDDSRTCLENYCQAKLDTTIMDVVVTANGLTYRRTLK